ncbi:DUF2946 family protein [Sphaerotilus sp.]|jgi:Protein of unknown function (DUF2946)|uniref:DUF2946 family protein n=1 Tax=Sphaerotilus sp. TaxID=2093942 RepID=UPI0025CF0D46|nr:DUF2946 family protein [Sphaerotilus sp.]
MDDIVRQALKKWPNVPDCRGWLALDARGDWYMRDDRTQAAGPFPQVKGSRILHDKLREFIGRNYEADADGCWFFQNGPQKVFVELEAAPWVFGVQWLDGLWRVETQTGRVVPSVDAVLVDEQGRLFLDTPIGLGLVRSADMDAAADAVIGGVWVPQEVPFAGLPARFGYYLSPQQRVRVPP